MTDDLWKGYINIWCDEKVAGLASTNSQKRRSNPDGEGIPVHFNGAKSFYRRKDEMTVENGGVEPNMMAFIEDVYKSKKTGKIVYKKAKQIVETLKEQVNDLQSKEPLEDGLVQPLSCPEINDLVRKAIPKKKGNRFGFGFLPDHEELDAPFLPSLDHEKKLEEAYNKISELVKEKEEDTKTIQYLKDVIVFQLKKKKMMMKLKIKVF
ncbi:PREDICTED: uncharacterized protein LOC104793464 isoform X1 [Camelina sativa]|uniref:Uncharacterized protein LOC104793464 isoform X1 n=1 Tax=Camelina sativa TaxID=90675 RepID=A0ABM0ZN66_CAMSA|nr:PREDICTED: uncharacterized protein LOC104793464 isoform X1 [Camelina sativa]XP_010518119.1 PREDICTED: uncharacterized protein LOC104793464 isoform X1 [Camelina sativa]XP_010518120.1 PREDICTED: uncharacterized protein LOC104793464 isoform X1 [Camelina sativa]